MPTFSHPGASESTGPAEPTVPLSLFESKMAIDLAAARSSRRSGPDGSVQ